MKLDISSFKSIINFVDILDKVDDGIHIEIKGMSSPKPNKVSNNIKEGFEQVYADNNRYPTETHREGKVIILSKYKTAKEAYTTVYAGFRKARSRGYVNGKVELWHNGRIIKLK